MKLQEACDKLNKLVGIKFSSLFSAEEMRDIIIAKGKTGQLLELALGMNLSSADLDFEDGELKTNKCDKNGKPYETVFITQISAMIDELLAKKEFEKTKRPDIYVENDITVYGIEHFEYDAHKRNRNGSVQRGECAKMKRSANERIKEAFKTQDSITTFYGMNSKTNEDYYKANFIESFTEHYRKIGVYKKHLSDVLKIDSNKISMWFIAEDTTPLGSYFICRNKPKQGEEPAFPLYFKEIETLFLTSAELDGIIFADNCNKILTLVKRDERAVKELKESHYYHGEPLFFFEPKFASTAVKILGVEK